MFKDVLPLEKKNAPRWARGKAYVRFTPKMLYISGEAMRMLGMPSAIGISIDAPNRMMLIRPHGLFKLSTVCETQDARRIETNRALESMLGMGFPRGMIGKHLTPATMTMDGAMLVSLIPDYDQIKA